MNHEFILNINKRILDLCYRSTKQRIKHIGIVNQLESYYNWTKSFSEIYYLIANKIYQPINKCQVCDNLTKFKNGHYNKFCSPSCSSSGVSDECKNKRKVAYKRTMLENYGVDNYYKTKEFHDFRFSDEGFEEKRKKGCKEAFVVRFGGESPFCDPNIKNKAELVIEERYGNRSFFGSEKYSQNRDLYLTEEIKQKAIENSLKSLRRNYDNENITSPWSIKEIQNKIEITNLERYGCKRPMQNYESHIKNMKSGFRLKIYMDRFGNTHYLQGYEPEVFKILENENKILESDCSLLPKIKLRNERVYYPDLFDLTNKIIYEVKSDYTYSIAKDDKLPMCHEACKNLGYKFIVLIYCKKTKTMKEITY